MSKESRVSGAERASPSGDSPGRKQGLVFKFVLLLIWLFTTLAFVGPFWATISEVTKSDDGELSDELSLSTGLFFGAFGKHFKLKLDEEFEDLLKDSEDVNRQGQNMFPPVSCQKFAANWASKEQRDRFCYDLHRYTSRRDGDADASSSTRFKPGDDVIDVPLAVSLGTAALAYLLVVLVNVRGCRGRITSGATWTILALLLIATIVSSAFSNWTTRPKRICEKLIEEDPESWKWHFVTCFGEISMNGYTRYSLAGLSPVGPALLLVVVVLFLPLASCCLQRRNKLTAKVFAD